MVRRSETHKLLFFVLCESFLWRLPLKQDSFRLESEKENWTRVCVLLIRLDAHHNAVSSASAEAVPGSGIVGNEKCFLFSRGEAARVWVHVYFCFSSSHCCLYDNGQSWPIPVRPPWREIWWFSICVGTSVYC